MKLTMLGTGNASVSRVYNSCFVLEDEGRHILVDGGGGSQILRQLEDAGYSWKDMLNIFVTHRHIDHLFGIIWMVRFLLQGMRRGLITEKAAIYSHEEVIGLIMDISKMLIDRKELPCLGSQLELVTVQDGERRVVQGKEVTFFDIHSTKAKQFGFSLEYRPGLRLTCCGDEPFNPLCEPYVQGSEWLIHEAFCLYSQADIFKPYEKSHSTVREACQLAERLHIPNLVLYHTEDRNIADRKRLYTEEGTRFYSGNLYVPDDLDTLEL